MSRVLVPLAALAIAILSGVAYCEGRRAADADHALTVTRAALDTARAQTDSALHREATWHGERDSLRTALAASTHRLDSLSRRITIMAPGVIQVASDPNWTEWRSNSPPRIDTVVVPRVVTDDIQAQAREIATLRRSLAVADSGWTTADSVIAAQGRALRAQATEIAALRHTTRHWYDRLGVFGGYAAVARPDGAVSHGVALGLGVKLWP